MTDGHRLCANAQCNRLLPLSMFRLLRGKYKTWYSRCCLGCIREKNAAYKRNVYKNAPHREKILLANKKHYSLNKNKILTNMKLYYENNKGTIKIRSSAYGKSNREKLRKYERQYRIKNKDRIKITKKIYRDNILSIDLNYKLRTNISSAIRHALKKKNYSKDKKSINDYIDYSIQELKEHLESLFEPWMNWNNWGVYNYNMWNDNDSSTWTWNIDHIIPHSQFDYTSMEDDEFKACWSLSNLRPYSSKHNIIDGSIRIRHAH